VSDTALVPASTGNISVTAVGLLACLTAVGVAGVAAT